MFQTWEEFTYMECGKCGCLQIAEIPKDLSRYYPESYYSLRNQQGLPLKRFLRSAAIRYHSGNYSIIGWILSLAGFVPSEACWLEICKPKLNWRILDVGCGQGARLKEFAIAGFNDLSGVDPFVAQDIQIAKGVIVRKGELEIIQGEFDLIMFHHSLEHVVDPISVLFQAANLLALGGIILIHVPVMGKWAWRHYGIDWVQLDAPRHLHIFTENAVNEMALKIGRSVDTVIYDSFELQFIGSEKVRQSRANTTRRTEYNAKDIHRYRGYASKLNIIKDGDQAIFLVK